jgi:hypothetical protein
MTTSWLGFGVGGGGGGGVTVDGRSATVSACELVVQPIFPCWFVVGNPLGGKISEREFFFARGNM